MAQVQNTTRPKATRKAKSPFRGVLERMATTRAMKLDLGMIEAGAAETELVVDEATGEAFAVTLKRLSKSQR